MPKRRKKQARKLTARQSFLKRSRAAKKGWVTRRRNLRLVGITERVIRSQKVPGYLKRRALALNTLRKVTKRQAKEIEELRALVRSKASKADIARAIEHLGQGSEIVERIQENAEKNIRISFLQEAHVKDPESVRESIKERLRQAWKEDPKAIPELVIDIYREFVEADLGDDYDETEIWNLYEET